MKPSQRLDHIHEYIFSRLASEVKRIEKETGKKVLNFAPGIPDIKPSRIYMKKLEEFLCDEKAHYYPGYTAIPEFSDGLINRYQKRFNVSLEENELLPLLGAKDGVTHLPLTMINEGDEVLIPDPGYPAYESSIKLYGGIPVPYTVEKTLDIKKIEEKITGKTKLIWVNFPANPTGYVTDMTTLENLVALAKKHDILLAYDNAYAEITFDDYIAPSILQIKGAKDIAVELGSFSKSYSFAGFRMGWIVGNKDVISWLAKTKAQIDSGLSLPLQKLGGHVLSHPDILWHETMIADYKNRQDKIAVLLKELGLQFDLPKGGLYIWAKIPDGEKSSEAYCMKSLQEKHILFTPGSAFGKNGEGYVRVSICVNIRSLQALASSFTRG